ncbi:ATP synthase F0 subcomplex A subunit [Tistlia consotensis]|uniref:ATP synthase subunit a n=1 Tax=Tistlia consotensis USBA 355 TaxID=560819 RepID=A0A1Y6CQH6_9PROT|nr:F0F1 ATP synthase subunit A [Tistlia consotensis]SMF81305.1 ATP synthase F0 subcomplex A subunit [Tistlia consotensis USBA 355]SNS22979.1 ATP synthase F0 subcomplex A subunit [Tistlia consotensis]
MIESPLTTTVLFQLGPVPVSRPVVISFAITLLLAAGGWLLARRPDQDEPGRLRTAVEVLLETIEEQIRDTMRIEDARPFLPLLGTLFLFLLCANLVELFPGLEAPTGHIETTAALAVVVFFAVHLYGIRAHGLAGYLGRFAKPFWLMLPLNVLAEFTRTLALAVRLFGNIMSGGFMIGLAVALVGLLVPVPLLALEALVGVIQAYIFTVLAAVFIGAAVGQGGEAG